MTVRSSNCSVSGKFFPMLVKTPSFGGVINPKTNLNYELGSKFFFLSDLAYKLVNLLVFKKCSCKMRKNWTFQKIIGPGLNFTYEFEVCSINLSISRWCEDLPINLSRVGWFVVLMPRIIHATSLSWYLGETTLSCYLGACRLVYYHRCGWRELPACYHQNLGIFWSSCFNYKTDFKFIGKVESQTNNFWKSSVLAHYTWTFFKNQ